MNTAKAAFCLCNGITLPTIKESIDHHREDLAREGGLLEATGKIYRCARDKTTHTPDKNPCASCFDVVARHIKKDTGLFQDEKLPERAYSNDCPRRQQARVVNEPTVKAG